MARQTSPWPRSTSACGKLLGRNFLEAVRSGTIIDHSVSLQTHRVLWVTTPAAATGPLSGRCSPLPPMCVLAISIVPIRAKYEANLVAGFSVSALAHRASARGRETGSSSWRARYDPGVAGTRNAWRDRSKSRSRTTLYSHSPLSECRTYPALCSSCALLPPGSRTSGCFQINTSLFIHWKRSPSWLRIQEPC